MIPKAPKHNRIRPKAKTAPTAVERRHMTWVASFGCLVCGQSASLHHVMKCPGKVRRRDHRFVVPLCREHHQEPRGVHGLGSEEAFYREYGINLPWIAVTLWERSCDENFVLNR